MFPARLFRPLLEFRDRAEAGRLLGEELEAYRGKDALVLGIPRGGLAVAAEVAQHLDADLDVVVTRKLGAPCNPDFSVGAVTASGGCYLKQDYISALGISTAYLDEVTAKQMAEARAGQERFHHRSGLPPMRDRIVIVVDDGLATGATMQAALRSVRRQHPARLVAAVPVGTPEACASLSEEVDELVCMYQPERMGAIGLFYQDFDPMDDADAEQILSRFHARRPQSYLLRESGSAPNLRLL